LLLTIGYWTYQGAHHYGRWRERSPHHDRGYHQEDAARHQQRHGRRRQEEVPLLPPHHQGIFFLIGQLSFPEWLDRGKRMLAGKNLKAVRVFNSYAVLLDCTESLWIAIPLLELKIRPRLSTVCSSLYLVRPID
jgi:hypothetical protein